MIGFRSCARATLTVLILCSCATVTTADGDPCNVVTVGLHLGDTGNSGGAFLGHCPGQTFLTHDTVMRSLTVWRVPEEYFFDIGMHLYVTETDSTGFPLLNRVVVEGPTLVLFGDGVNPTPFRWDFDPPVILPRPGTYAFFVCQDPCLVYFDVLTTAEDVGLYPDGISWCTERSAACNLYGTWPDPFPRGDLIFQVEFCRDAPTPVRGATWGEVKVLYR
jgi:hypothetical protein